MKDPAVLFYFQDFLVGTEFMTDEEVGKYIRLLCHQADKGSLTFQQMLRICRTPNIPPAIMEKFQQNGDGNFYQERMKIERDRRMKYSDSRRKNREAKQDDMKNISETYDTHMEIEIEKENVYSNDVKNLYAEIEIFFDENLRPKTLKQENEWLDTLDKLIRIDGYSTDYICEIIRRARMDDFWRQNFLSVLKLRKKNKEGIAYFTVFEKKFNNGTKKDVGADPIDLAILTADKVKDMR